MRDIAILITMDVEPVKLQARWTGPATAVESERSLRAYRKMAARRGFALSCFVHPEAATLHAALFRQWMNEGVCLGLHVHPTKFRYPRYKHEFGFYTPDEQREMLTDASDEWAQALGRKPVLFRPGAFSANDTTLPTLAGMGFTGGSVSIPGRIWPKRYCVWSGAELYPHRGHRVFRQLPGDLDFANIPLSVDTSAEARAPGMFCYQDLRPTARGVPALTTLRNIVARIAADRPPLPVLQIVTHNDQPFEDPASESHQRFAEVLDAIAPVCAEHGLAAASGSFEEVCDRVLAQPKPAPAEWLENNEVPM